MTDLGTKHTIWLVCAHHMINTITKYGQGLQNYNYKESQKNRRRRRFILIVLHLEEKAWANSIQYSSWDDGWMIQNHISYNIYDMLNDKISLLVKVDLLWDSYKCCWNACHGQKEVNSMIVHGEIHDSWLMFIVIWWLWFTLKSQHRYDMSSAEASYNFSWNLCSFVVWWLRLGFTVAT